LFTFQNKIHLKPNIKYGLPQLKVGGSYNRDTVYKHIISIFFKFVNSFVLQVLNYIAALSMIRYTKGKKLWRTFLGDCHLRGRIEKELYFVL
jgi:hypothetical protein